MSRYARRVDDNHREVVATFEALGCRVRSTAALGRGFPDLLVLCRGMLHLVEVKDGRKPKSERKLTPAEEAFAKAWPVSLVECREDATRLVREWGGPKEESREQASREARLKLARKWWVEHPLRPALDPELSLYTPFGTFSAAELEAT